VNAPARVGIVGCGVISDHYAENAKAFGTFRVVACADRDAARADALAAKHGFASVAVEELLADPEIDVVLNLTPPGAHVAVLRAALAAGKHVYTEKPLATTVADGAEALAESERLGLRVGCAPDIFLGGAYQAARKLIDEGAIGEPLSASGAMLVGGPESWHPDPDSFYGNGAGPMLDMGPYYLTAIAALLGPLRRAAGFASIRVAERVIGAGPRKGERFRVTTPTHTTAAFELEGGATATLVTSFEASGYSACDLEIHGTEGALSLPDPNYFGGVLRVKRGREEWQDVPYDTHDAREARGIGIEDLVAAVAGNRPHRASGRLALHVLDAGTSLLRAAVEGRTVDVETRCERPEPLAHVGGGQGGDG
jgi:predicted dehydrogenase